MGKDLRTFLDKVKEVQDAGTNFKESGYVEVGRRVQTYLDVPLLQEKLRPTKMSSSCG